MQRHSLKKKWVVQNKRHNLQMQKKNLLTMQLEWLISAHLGNTAYVLFQTFWQYQLFYWRHNSKCLQNMNTIWQLSILLFFLTVRNVREALWNKTFVNSPCCKSSRRLLVELKTVLTCSLLDNFFFLNILFYLNIISLYKLCWLVGRLPSKYLMYYFWYS